MSEDRLHIYGIRHHGPGSAASLRRALEALQPEVVVVEGPPEADELIPFVTRGLVPPVALLLHPAEAPEEAVFYPFAEWSPEWVALSWAHRNGRVARFIDLPRAYRKRPEHEVGPEEETADTEGGEGAVLDDVEGGEAALLDEPKAEGGLRERDPFGALAALDGYDDGEAWWNALVEEGSSRPEDLFAAIERAVAVLRKEMPDRDEETPAREAFMRQSIRYALKHSSGPVAAVVGAWHAPSVRPGVSTQRDDKAQVGRAKRMKTVATWVPWSDSRLAAASGYGAGVLAPGWYRKLWALDRHEGGPGAARALATSWQIDVARALRRHQHDAPPATIIDAVRLSEVLTAMRGRARPGLSELKDASLATFCAGEPARWKVVEQSLLVGERLGSIPDDVPQMPLAADLAREQRRLRLPPQETPRELSLDLRSESGQGRSVLLHRLQLLEVPWGVLSDYGRSRGTFREKWQIAWEVELSVRLAEALRWGSTVASAAEARARERLDTTDDLLELAEAVQVALPSDLPEAVRYGAERLQAASVAAADVEAIAEAIPPLVDLTRYGTARDLPLESLVGITGRLMDKVHVGVHYAARNLDVEATAVLHQKLAAYDRAVHVFEDGAWAEGWTQALSRLADDPGAAARIRGFAVRRARDTGTWPDERVGTELAAVLSPGVSLEDAAGWLEGFLGEAGQLILGDQRLFSLIDEWLTGLEEEALKEALPLFRRASSNFSPADRRKVLDMAAGRRADVGATRGTDDTAVFREGEALLDLILGLDEKGGAS